MAKVGRDGTIIVSLLPPDRLLIYNLKEIIAQ